MTEEEKKKIKELKKKKFAQVGKVINPDDYDTESEVKKKKSISGLPQMDKYIEEHNERLRKLREEKKKKDSGFFGNLYNKIKGE